MDNNIDWYRVSKPQDDGYDSLILDQFLTTRFNCNKPTVTSALTLCDGRVAVLPDPGSHTSPAMLDPWNVPDLVSQLDRLIADVDHHLKAWPAGYHSLGMFLDEFYPKYWPEEGRPNIPRMPAGMRGSSSGHEQRLDQFGILSRVNIVYVTVNDPWGCSQGIYHEVAHLRLKALGMGIDEHDGRLISNPITDGFQSPVRKSDDTPFPIDMAAATMYDNGVFSIAQTEAPTRVKANGEDLKQKSTLGELQASVGSYFWDRQTLYVNSPQGGDSYVVHWRVAVTRPMCAVIQGLYAWIVFTENDWWLAQRGPIELDRAKAEFQNNIPKIKEGVGEVRRYATPTPEGEPFLQGMLDWADDLIHRVEVAGYLGI